MFGVFQFGSPWLAEGENVRPAPATAVASGKAWPVNAALAEMFRQAEESERNRRRKELSKGAPVLIDASGADVAAWGAQPETQAGCELEAAQAEAQFGQDNHFANELELPASAALILASGMTDIVVEAGCSLGAASASVVLIGVGVEVSVLDDLTDEEALVLCLHLTGNLLACQSFAHERVPVVGVPHPLRSVGSVSPRRAAVGSRSVGSRGWSRHARREELDTA